MTVDLHIVLERLLQLYTLAALLLAAGLTGLRLTLRLRIRREPWREALERKYLRLIVRSLLAGRRHPPRLPASHRRRTRLLLAETLAGVVRATCGLDPELLRRIVSEYALDHLLLRRIRRTRGCRRAYWLSQLAALPADEPTVRRASRYARDPDRFVRFYTLLLRLSHAPSQTLRLIAEYPEPLTAFEIDGIVALLRRGLLPVACDPLLASPDRNLRALGLALVRRFGIDEAEPALLRIVDRDPSDELAREALLTLCTLRRPLARRAVARRMASMDCTERQLLLRRMAFEGYAPGALRRLLAPDERPGYESLVCSYKRYLTCSSRDF